MASVNSSRILPTLRSQNERASTDDNREPSRDLHEVLCFEKIANLRKWEKSQLGSPREAENKSAAGGYIKTSRDANKPAVQGEHASDG